MKQFRSLLQILDRMFLVVSVSALALMTTLSFVQVVVRYVFRGGIVWAQPMTLVLLEITSFTGAAVAVQRKRDIVVTALLRALPKPVERVVLFVATLLAAATALFILTSTPRLIGMQGQVMQILPWPRYVLTLPMVVSLGMIALSLIASAFDFLAGEEVPV
ncbi:MAG TPA: TRAP transporter small permease subunit [Trueperaceae bacterium]|nr:TRAP transporter small permease subunit [Trueperaceae bacterium]